MMMGGNKVTEWKVEGEPTQEMIARAAAEMDLALIELV